MNKADFNEFKVIDTKFIYLAAIFIGLLIICNVIAGKITTIWIFTVPTAVLAYALTFLMTDAISEVYGKERAKQVVLAGFVASVVAVIMVYVAIIAPPAVFWEHQGEFESILGVMPRVVFASMVAYLISQLHDVYAFHFWRGKTKGKHLWLRNNASTMVSQLMDTIVFITIAFYGLFPIGTLIFYQYLAKLLIALCDTPFVYMLVRWCR